jgi:hypothetical protein
VVEELPRARPLRALVAVVLDVLDERFVCDAVAPFVRPARIGEALHDAPAILEPLENGLAPSAVDGARDGSAAGREVAEPGRFVSAQSAPFAMSRSAA